MTLPTPCLDWALFLDFDGTLVDIAPTPALVQVPERHPSLLLELRAVLNDAVAIISGRPIRDIDRFLGMAVPAVAGLYGIERRTAGLHRADVPPVDAGLAHARCRLGKFAARHTGILLEEKGPTVALHYRRAPALAGACRSLVLDIVSALGGGWHVAEGKAVLELVPDGFSKGAAIEAFMKEAPFAGRTPVFCGDDRADEFGFAAVNKGGGISIRVGQGGPTAARFHAESVADLLAWLQRIVEAGIQPSMPLPPSG